jgi:hypothetical protein
MIYGEVTGSSSDHLTTGIRCRVAATRQVIHHCMAPFEPPDIVLTGLKERVDSLSLQGTVSQSGMAAQLTCDTGDRLYVGTAAGTLSVYSVTSSSGTYHRSLARPLVCNYE